MVYRFEDISFFRPAANLDIMRQLPWGGGGGGLIPCERGWGCKDRRVLGLSFIYPIPRVSEDLLPPKSLSEIPTFPSSFYIVCLFTHSPSDNIGKTTFLPLAPLNKSRPFRTEVRKAKGEVRKAKYQAQHFKSSFARSGD